MGKVQVAGMEMQYMEFGCGKRPFVILPGLSIHSVMGLSHAVRDSYKEFADEYTVYLFDRPSPVENGCTIREMARDTALAMQELSLSKTDVFGASQGGMIALCLAIDYPELCNKIVLGSTLAHTNDTLVGVVNEWIGLAKDRNEERLLGSFIERVYSKETVDKYKDVLLDANRGISDEEYERFIILASTCLNFDISDDLKRIQVPALVLGSKGDNVVTSAGSLEIASALGCECYIYPKTYGHAVYDEALDYKMRILEFLRVK